MRYRWSGKKVDLDDLFQATRGFFEGRDFCSIMRLDRIKRSMGVRVVPPQTGRPGEILVTVRNTRKGFEMGFSWDKAAGVFARSGILSTMLGTGFMFKGKLDDIAFLEKLENEFWLFVEDKVAELRK